MISSFRHESSSSQAPPLLLLLLLLLLCNSNFFLVPFNPHSMLTSSLFSTLSLTAFLVLLLLASNLSLSIRTFSSNKEWELRSSSSWVGPLSATEEHREERLRDPDHVLAPLNVTVDERIAWFKRNMHSFGILRANELTGQFRKRAETFFNGRCEARFFMTWISPARLFGRRELLAVESLFKAHPRGCLLILSTTLDSRHGSQPLKQITNSGFRALALPPDLPFLLKNTPAEAWFDDLKRGNVDPGEIPLPQNLSNLLRLLAVYKFGGVYLDTDVIVLKKFSGLKNIIGAQAVDPATGNWTRLNNAILIFDKKHPLVYKFIQEFALTFNGNKWGHNGPYLVSRVVERIERRPGYNFSVLPPMAFYPVDWNRIGGLFQRPENPKTARWAAAKLLQLREETYAIHLWNKQSGGLKIEEGSVMGRLISDHCLFCKDSYT